MIGCLDKPGTPFLVRDDFRFEELVDVFGGSFEGPAESLRFH